MFTIPKKPGIELKEKKPDARSYAVLPIRAINDKRLTRGDYVNLMLICSYCSAGGYTFAALSTMAAYRGIKAPTLCVGLKRLTKFGYVETIRKGYSGLRGSLKRVIFDASLSIDDAISISNTPINQPTSENIHMAKQARKAKVLDNTKANDTAISFNDAVLVVSHSIKSDSDLLTLERLVSQGITLDQLKHTYNIV